MNKKTIFLLVLIIITFSGCSAVSKLFGGGGDRATPVAASSDNTNSLTNISGTPISSNYSKINKTVIIYNNSLFNNSNYSKINKTVIIYNNSFFNNSNNTKVNKTI